MACWGSSRSTADKCSMQALALSLSLSLSLALSLCVCVCVRVCVCAQLWGESLLIPKRTQTSRVDRGPQVTWNNDFSPLSKQVMLSFFSLSSFLPFLPPFSPLPFTL